uniref:Uncharacterized protein n=1 Tax=Heterorhabditis bacteriophora TaxID=37862 RepID=A0A1I7WXL8_HETBA
MWFCCSQNRHGLSSVASHNIEKTKEEGDKNLEIFDEEDSDSESYKPHQMSNISEPRLQIIKEGDTTNQRQGRKVHPRFGEMRKDVRRKSPIAMALLCITLLTHITTGEVKTQINSNNLNCDNGIVSVKPDNKDRLPISPINARTRITINSSNSTTDKLCAPLELCRSADTLLSRALIRNPHCWPAGAITSAVIIVYALILICLLIGWAINDQKKR